VPPSRDELPSAPPPASAQEQRILLRPLARFLGWLIHAYVRLVARTVRVSGPPVFQPPAILAVWHEANLLQAVAIWRLRSDRRFVSFSTRGFRGIVMNGMIEGLRGGVVALPPESARAEAGRLARAMGAYGRAGWSLAVACDGPLGPYRVAKPGALLLARESGLPIVPWAVVVRPAIRLRQRWDRQVVPLPFSRLRVVEGVPLWIAEGEALKPRLADLQSELDRVAAEADRRSAPRQRVP
jgi:lysophospholipid acyltransferase (LPLAT)-like uncharacterized protein